jgi:hypothetical protein
MTTPTRLTEVQTHQVQRVLADLAQDYLDEKTLVQHVEGSGLPDQSVAQILALLADLLGFEGHGYDDHKEYLEAYQRVMGVSNLKVITQLREELWQRGA